MLSIVEMDETMFRYSEKGSHELSRPIHQRGGDKADRGGANDDWVAVLVPRRKPLSMTQSVYR